MIKKLIQSFTSNSFRTKIKDKLGVPSQQNSFRQLKSLGFSPAYCLDIGAYQGTWTKEFKTIYPTCGVLMIEGQHQKEQNLIDIKNIYKDVDYRILLLGASEALVSFNKYETASSVLPEHYHTNAVTEQRQLTLLDTLTRQINFKPDLIKIDTQGYELEILKGCNATLKCGEFVLLEVSFLDIYVNCPLAADVISYLDNQGFVIYDICTLMKRPLDNALYQADIPFVKKQSRFRNDKRWG
jgi:FkbM family methyltransferase